MNLIKYTSLAAAILLCGACSQFSQAETPQATIQALHGTWATASENTQVHFYMDETVKLSFPEHTPPFKLISDYQIIKDNHIGITLGGVWTGPALVNTKHIAQQSITITLPDEKTLELHKVNYTTK
ncbi:MAG: hypothetical protein R8K49_07680 [Mariprofundaceae bacterium]